jgi:hypothetical protein
LEVEHTTIKEDPTEKFSALIMEPTTPWNYAVDPKAEATVLKNSTASNYPYDSAPEF